MIGEWQGTVGISGDRAARTGSPGLVAATRKTSKGDIIDGHDIRMLLPPGIALEEAPPAPARPPSPLAQAAEYLGLGLLVLVFGWMLLYASTMTHTQRRGSPKAWPQPRADHPGWMEQHQKYVSKVTIMQQENLGIETIFYGDSITEMWLGTIHDRPDPRAAGVPDVFTQVFGPSAATSTAIFAISGDSSSHLMWRLLNGEAPYDLKVKAIVLLIGTNDLMYASFQGDEAIARVGNATVHHLARILQLLGEAAPQAQIIALALLPRGDMTRHPESSIYKQPSKFTPVVNFINRELQVVADAMETVRYLDCGRPYVTQDGSALVKELLPDALHPSLRGMKLLGECIHEAVEEIIGH